jgi:hypothetical protein
MEQFLKRKLLSSSDKGTSGACACTDTELLLLRPCLTLLLKEVNLDENYPVDRKRITKYPSHILQDNIRRTYFVRCPYQPQPVFNYPQTIIVNK